MKNTPAPGTDVGSEASEAATSRNGHRSDAVDLSDIDRLCPRRGRTNAYLQIVWTPPVMLADALGVDPDNDTIHESVDSKGWEAFKTLRRRYGVAIDPTTTVFADLDAVHDGVWHACGLTPPSANEIAKFVADYYRPLPDPQKAGQRLIDARSEHWREHNAVARALTGVSVAAGTTYSIEHVRAKLGDAVADAAVELIDRHNLRAWEAPQPRPKERPYLTTAADLHKLGVKVDAIAALTAATNRDHDTALRLLARARKTHRDMINMPDDVGAPLAEAIRHAVDMVDDPPTGVIVNGLLYEENVVSWVGGGGSLKTFTVLDISCRVAAGIDVTHQLRVAGQHGVAFLCAERRHQGLIGDIRAWCRKNGVEFDRERFRMYGWDDVVQLANAQRMRELTEFVIERGIKLVVIDTQSKATVGLDENSATAMSMALRNAEKLARAAKCVVIIIHHTTRGQDHARGSTVIKDNTDVTIRQEKTGPNEAEFIIDKHKSVAVDARYPVKAEKITVTVPDTDERAGYSYSTLVASARDPLTGDEQSEHVRAALSHDDKLILTVINEHDGDPLTPAEIHRRAEAKGCRASSDTVRRHLETFAKRGYGLVVEHINPANRRKTYSAKSSGVPQSQHAVDADADVVDLASRRKTQRSKTSSDAED